MDFEPHTHIPRKWEKELKGKAADEMAERLSYHRTELSTHRTILSTARSHMSNERTHLSYLRTSLSLMSLGVTLNRLSLYLRQNEAKESVHLVLYDTERLGGGMVVIGLILLCWALYRYRKVSVQIENDTYESPKMAMTIITAVVVILGTATTFWLWINRF